MATVVGSLKRRGPALPGLIKRIPRRFSISGLCEWPETTAVNPAASGWWVSDTSAVRTLYDCQFRRRRMREDCAPRRLIVVIAAHGSDGRDASEHVQNRWIADVAAMNDEVRVAQRVEGASGRIKPWVSDIRPTRCDEGDMRSANVFKADVILSV